MNDRFKFRVWWNSPYINEESKYLYYDPKKFCHTTDIVRDASCDDVEDIVYYDIRDIILGDIDEFEKPNTFIIEQCTGLKDKNGNLIYEGDIVKIPDDWETYGFMSGEKREVYFCDGGFRLKPKDTKLGRGHWLEQTSALEIIGNIHEQAEQKDK